MNLQLLKDDFSYINEAGFKIPKRNASNFNIQNRLKDNLILQAPTKLNKSITKLKMKKKYTKNEGNIKDSLHNHKIGLQRNYTRKIIIKGMKNNDNDSFMNNKQYLNECKSLDYSPKEKNNKKIEAQNYELRKEKTQDINLKQIENLLFNKLNNMKFNFHQNEILEDINNDYKYNSDNLIDSKNCDFSSGFKSARNNLSVNNSYYKNKFKTKKKKSITSSFNQNNNNNNLNENKRSSFFPNIKENEEKNNINQKLENIKTEILQVPKEKSSVDSDKNFLLLSDANQKFKNKVSTKNIYSNFAIKEKSRNLSRIRPLYDSFDDDESDKEDEDNSSVILPYSPIIYFLDIFLFISSFYTLFNIPLLMAKADCFCSDESKTNKILLYFIDILYIFDFCISFFRAYYNFKLKLIKKNRKIIFHYLKTDGVFDFLEAIPIFSLSKYLCARNKEVNYCFKYNMSTSLIILKIMANIKIIKIFKIRNKQRNIIFYYILDLFSENYSLEKFLNNLIDFSFVFLAFHFFICLNIFLAKQTYPNWLITINTQDQTLLYNYITSSYSLAQLLDMEM